MDSLFINGEWSSANGADFSSINPISGHVVWDGKAANKADVQAVCSVAKEAFKTWSLLPFEQRLMYIEKFKVALEEKKEVFAKTISLETGKVLWECRQELAGMLAKVEISKKAYLERNTLREFELSEGTWSRTRYRAIGVMAVFGPFNFPGHLPNGHIIPALLAGIRLCLNPAIRPRYAVNLWSISGKKLGFQKVC